MDHEETQNEVAAYFTDLAMSTDAKYKFKQAFKLGPSRNWIPEHHLILKLKPFHFSSKPKPAKKTNILSRKRNHLESKQEEENKYF